MLVGLLSIFVLAIASPLLVPRFGRAAGWVIAALPAGLAVYLATYIPAVASGRIELGDFLWISILDIRLAFVLDGLSLLMALLITGIGALVVIFAEGYLPAGKDKGRFYLFLLLFMGSMLGLVLADDLVVLFVFWELTSFSSYLLIGFYNQRPEARAAALQALVITGGGGLALLAGLIMLGHAGGSMRFSELIGTAGVVTQHEMYLPMLMLILLGAFTKSAQFPFHFWLPNAMQAPAPVSAYLHAATMVKAGIYLLARVNPIVGGTALWQNSLMLVGGATLAVATVLTLRQRDMKRLLAYSTVSSLGAMTLLLGIGTSQALAAMIVFLLAHALYKGALFLVAGTVDHATGERRVDHLGGLGRVMPMLAAAAVAAAISMAGLPPLFGFIAKEGFLDAVVGAPWATVGTVVAVTSSAVLVTVAFLVGMRPFVGRSLKTDHHFHRPEVALLIGPLGMALAGLLLGIWPSLAAPLTQAAAEASAGHAIDMKLALWHGLNLPLMLSAIAIAAGGVLYFRWDRVCALGDRLQVLGQWGPARIYEVLMKGLSKVAVAQARVVQSGYLRMYMLIIVVATVGLVTSMLGSNVLVLPEDWLEARPHEILLAGLVIAAALAVIRARSWLGAVAAMGVVGFGVAAVFILNGAPDLAMTQFLVETLTVILFVLIVYHLPQLNLVPSRGFAFVKTVVAVSAGAMMSILVLAAAAGPTQRHVSEYYMRHSVPEGFGRNVVNVILVDFRAIDTLGEITVLATAGLGVYALVQIRSLRRRRS